MRSRRLNGNPLGGVLSGIYQLDSGCPGYYNCAVYLSVRSPPMGRWMEVLRERPPAGEPYLTTRPDIIVDAIAPHPLIYVARYLGRTARANFPMLNRVYFESDAYVDEDLWLDATEASQLLDELRRLRQVCHYEQFIPGLDGRVVLSRWCGDDDLTAFEQHLVRIESLLQTAAENQFWIRLML
jgi:hypothetical protein